MKTATRTEAPDRVSSSALAPRECRDVRKSIRVARIDELCEHQLVGSRAGRELSCKRDERRRGDPTRRDDEDRPRRRRRDGDPRGDARRGKLGGEPGRDDLVEALRLGQPFQLERAERAQVEGGVGRADRVGGELGHDDLPAVRRRSDPSGAMHVQPDVAVVDHGRGSGVKPDADPHRLVTRPRVRRHETLALDRRLGRVGGTLEDEEQAVSLAVDLLPAERTERLAHEPPVVGQQRPVRVTQAMQQLGGILDVGERERDLAGRQAGGRRLELERGLVDEDVALQPLKGGPRVDPELVDERTSRSLIRLERVRLAARSDRARASDAPPGPRAADARAHSS